MSNTTVLDARDLWCSYGTGETAISVIRGASLKVSRGEVVAVTGPSGSGKSTLLHALGLLDRPEGGTVTVCGRNGW
ncbi:MAG TPA: ATP-binding cassette domain-containing protein, partial [Candidatus Sabulitectum sp.]|nr:ATP-binding cassette domain-containing protein [Candidatus Sabulitectum sp.]